MACLTFLSRRWESLRSLMTPTTLILDAADVGRLRQAAPLCELICNVQCEGAEAVALLRCELVCPFYLGVADLDSHQQQRDFAAALATRTGIELLFLQGGNLAGATLEALARAVGTVGVEKISFYQCGLTRLALPALTLVFRSTVLRRFEIHLNGGASLFTGPDLPAFCDALRSNSSLKQIMLDNCDLWANPADAGMVLAALAARSTFFSLNLISNHVGETQAQQLTAGTQLAQLIIAGGLKSLELNGCSLGEAGLAHIFAALSVATRLERLDLTGEEMSSAFARDVVLPAVRANTSLRYLAFSNVDGDELLPELLEAQNIVAARPA